MFPPEKIDLPSNVGQTAEGEPFNRPVGILYRKGRSFSLATQKLLEVLSDKKPTLEAQMEVEEL